jgi:class 3 adenylate cyclase
MLSIYTRLMVRERKVVSVLFVDLVGFTAQSESVDPEDVDSLLRGYHRDVRREIERFGGTVEKFIGDAVVAVFGAPVTHEDDAERAVRSALRILEATDLDVRLAVNTGEVLVNLEGDPALGEGMVTGDAVNTASRLQNAAPVRGILVGELTHRATERAIEYQELPAVVVKGKSEPVPVWRALQARSRFGVDAEAPAAAPFVGRQHEFELLQTLFERAVDETGVQLVTVAGEPGAGKTRLVAELRRWVDDRPELVTWRQGRCLPYCEGIAYWALGEVVKAQAGILDPGLGAAAEVRLAQHRPADALELLRELAASHASGMFTSWQAPRVVGTALSAGDTRLASALVERTMSYGLRLPPAVDLARALCTEAAGDVEMARDLFDQAGTVFAKLPGVWEHACCLIGSGRCLIGLRQPVEAAAAVAQARATFAQLDASPSVAECDALLTGDTLAAGGTP